MQRRLPDDDEDFKTRQRRLDNDVVRRLTDEEATRNLRRRLTLGFSLDYDTTMMSQRRLIGDATETTMKRNDDVEATVRADVLLRLQEETLIWSRIASQLRIFHRRKEMILQGRLLKDLRRAEAQLSGYAICARSRE